MSSEVENIKYYIELDTAVNFHLPVYYVLLNYFTSTIEMIGFVNEPLFIWFECFVVVQHLIV